MEKKSLVEVLTLFESVLCVYEEFLGVFQKYILLSLHKHLPFCAVILSQIGSPQWSKSQTEPKSAQSGSALFTSSFG